MTGEQLADVIARNLTDQPDIASCRLASMLHTDSVALIAVDSDGNRWVIHVLREPWSRPAA